MAYTLLVVIFIAANADHPAAAVPLRLGAYKTATACSEAATQVKLDATFDEYEKEFPEAVGNFGRVEAMCVPTPK